MLQCIENINIYIDKFIRSITASLLLPCAVCAVCVHPNVCLYLCVYERPFETVLLRSPYMSLELRVRLRRSGWEYS